MLLFQFVMILFIVLMAWIIIRDGFQTTHKYAMFTNTLIAVILGLVILAWASVIVARGAGHQFPTAYQLLRESPEIHRREWIAIRDILCLGMVFGLLLLTQLF